MKKNNMKIAIDFDGTCVAHEFPKVGKDIGAVPVLKELVNQGHKLILYTMRSDGQESGDTLTDAINWFKQNNIELYSIQKDIGQENWTSSNKCYAELYIDDAALGIPLEYQEDGRPFVNWAETKQLLILKGILKGILKTNDPVYKCLVYRNQGCPYIGGMFCDIKTCDILEEYEIREIEQQLYKFIKSS